MNRLMASAAVAAAMSIVPSLASAQNPLMDSVKAQHNMARDVILKTVAKVPENLFGFQPTPEVRTFARLFGHIADSSMGICASASGEKATPLNAEKTMTTKAQLSKALADAMAFCDKVIAGMDDKKGLEVTKFFTGPTVRAQVIGFNTAHNYEHYGNLVTYMRLNKIVPPSSEGSQ
jgi:uncharacterized damage-inducible protein DinB